MISGYYGKKKKKARPVLLETLNSVAQLLPVFLYVKITSTYHLTCISCRALLLGRTFIDSETGVLNSNLCFFCKFTGNVDFLCVDKTRFMGIILVPEHAGVQGRMLTRLGRNLLDCY